MSRIASALTLPICLLLLSGCRSETTLVWQQETNYRWADLGNWDGSAAGFEEVSPSRSGVRFVNTLREESLLQNRHYMNGSGVAVGDVDGDGWTDLYFARLDGPNVLYRNLGGWRFEDVTDAAGVAAPDRYSTGAVFADVDGDGDLDLLLTAMGGPNALYLNDGNGRFTEVTDEAGLASGRGSTTMALADIDGDGDLDLYVSNYKVRAANDLYPPAERSFDRTVVKDGSGYRIAPAFEEHYALVNRAGGLLRVEKAEPNRLYLNDGAGHFSAVPLAGSTFVDERGAPLAEAPLDWTLTARFQDVNGDGAPDLYVCNDFQSPDYFWLGDGRGGFRAVPSLAVRKTSFSTMSVDFSDIDRDGDLDFFLTDMLSRDYARRQTQVGATVPMTTAAGEIENRPQAVHNTLHLNRGDGTYAEIARLSGVAASDWTWSGLFLDVDLDGFEDLVLATGHLYNVLDQDAQIREMYAEGDPDAFRRTLLDYPTLVLRNVAFRNNGDLHFEYMADGWGLGTEPDVSNALAFGDFDNDGDLDAVVNRLNDTAGLFRNEASAPRLAVRLRGATPNTQAVGAKIRVSGGGLPDQVKEVVSGGIYLSGSDPQQTFAAGDPEALLTIDVTWRDGTQTRVDSVRANSLVEIFQDGGRASLPVDVARLSPEQDSVPLFDDLTAQLGHVHTESTFDDFAKNPLLRKRLSQSGPSLAWVDVDGDGDDDLLVGTGRGGRIALYRNDGTGGLSATTADLLGEPAPGDVTGIVATPTAEGARVFAGVSNYERGDSSWIYVAQLDGSGNVSTRERLPFSRASVGPLALGDLDGDGDLDLFAGARLSAGSYPGPAASRVFINDEGRYRYDAAISGPFREALVSGAAIGDLDGDGDQDIVLASDWGPIRYFENQGAGSFADQTAAVGLDEFSGWWNGVALGDFDGDGRLDLVGTNGGWNGEHGRLHRADRPVRAYYDDFDADGATEAIEAVYEPTLDDYVPLQGLTTLSQAMGYISQRIPTYEQFAASTLREIVGFRLDQARILEANTAAHMIFLQRADGSFEGRPLPLEAQFSMAFAPVVADFDGNGTEDLFLSQNFFALPMEVPRQDAGRGLLLLGDGNGGFNPVPGQNSGIAIYGEQRGAAASDVNQDGRVDLAVAQNGAATKLYGSVGGSSGLRVRLQGPTGNPAAVGATIRLRNVNGISGPARIVSAGSGYWGQHAAVQVMGPRNGAAEVVVRWPDGEETVVPVDSSAAELMISPSENLAAN